MQRLQGIFSANHSGRRLALRRKQASKTGKGFPAEVYPCWKALLTTYICVLEGPDVVHKPREPAGLLLVGQYAASVVFDAGVGDLG